MKPDFNNLQDKIWKVKNDASSVSHLMSDVIDQTSHDNSVEAANQAVVEQKAELKRLKEECVCWSNQLLISHEKERNLNIVIVDLKWVFLSVEFFFLIHF